MADNARDPRASRYAEVQHKDTRQYARGEGSRHGEMGPGGARRGADARINPCAVAFSESPSVPLGLKMLRPTCNRG